MASKTVSNQLIQSHIIDGYPEEGTPVAIKIDQALLQDATGTLVMLELMALGIDQVSIELAAQYVDHNLLQEDSKNPDDHLFLQSVCQRLGIYFSKPGNGVSHPVHMAKFCKPGATLLGSDSHTCAAGSMGMLAIGAGGVDVAMAIVGEPYYFKMPQIWGIELVGELSDWVSAKDVILELLRRKGVSGGRNKIFEYFGPGLKNLTAMDRHVIANMGAELGALTSVFPSDESTRSFLRAQRREQDWIEIVAGQGATYDGVEKIDLSVIEPLIARPSSPGNVVPVREVEGGPVYQSYIGSSANPGFRDFAIAAEMMNGKYVHKNVSFDVNPTSQEILMNLDESGYLQKLIKSGARIHQAGCNGCIGMGQAPATSKNSLRTTPRNFPGRSGTLDDQVWLCSPETAVAAALTGKITDPRTLGMRYPKIKIPENWLINSNVYLPPLPPNEAKRVKIIKGPNITDLVLLEELPDEMEIKTELKLGDDLSTDEILPAGAKVLPYRSNIQKISEFSFRDIDENYSSRVKDNPRGHAIIAGKNYGQGSSREHAALALVYLGLKVVIAKSYSRIHFQNLINFGVIPFQFKNEEDYQILEINEALIFKHLKEMVLGNKPATLLTSGGKSIELILDASERQREILLAGGVLNYQKKKMNKFPIHRLPSGVSTDPLTP